MVEAPCIFDDGDMFDQRPKVLKAFFGPTQFEAMTRERWGAAKFVKGQPRFVGDNKYDQESEPHMVIKKHVPGQGMVEERAPSYWAHPTQRTMGSALRSLHAELARGISSPALDAASGELRAGVIPAR